jgi:hypothetical protein
MDVQLIAGTISSMIFIGATFPMLYKAWSTRDMGSYSLAQIVMNNVGNLVHWLYIVALPFGPVWLLHSFYTVTTVFMLIWWLLYHEAPEIRYDDLPRHLRTTQEIAIG